MREHVQRAETRVRAWARRLDEAVARTYYIPSARTDKCILPLGTSPRCVSIHTMSILITLISVISLPPFLSPDPLNNVSVQQCAYSRDQILFPIWIVVVTREGQICANSQRRSAMRTFRQS